MAYGITTSGVIHDKEWFWDEVRLRAINNYGNWNNRIHAEQFVVQAIKDICVDNKLSSTKEMKLTHSHTDEIVKLAQEMMEDK